MISASPTQGSAQIQLSALQGGHCLQVEAGNQGADLVTFLRDCNFALLVGQRLKTVVSHGLSNFISNEGRASMSYYIIARTIPCVLNNLSLAPDDV